jgi:hypothetical protein
MPKLLKFIEILSGLFLILLSFSACADNTPSPAPTNPSPTGSTATTSTPGSAVTTAAPVTGAVSTIVATATSIAAANTTPGGAVAAPPNVVATDALARNRVETALKNLAGNPTGYSFKVTQSAQLKNGGAVSTVEGSGEGSYSAPNFYQKLDLNVSGQSQQSVENFLTNGTAYQKLANLDVWRKLDPALPVSANPPATMPNSAGGFQINTTNQGLTELRYIVPAALLFSQKDISGPETLGILSATEIYRAFLINPDPNAQAEIKLSGMESKGNQFLQHREVSFTLNGPGGTLTYKASYDYSYPTSPPSITPPANLPK